MATTTPNIGLSRPGYTDEVDITVLNDNFTIIDREIGSLKSLGGGGSSGDQTGSSNQINDLIVSSSTTYSSQKIEEKLSKKAPSVDDTVSSAAPWSGNKISTLISRMEESINKKSSINDSAVSLTSTYSSQKIAYELSRKSPAVDDNISGAAPWSGNKINQALSAKAEIKDDNVETTSTWSSQKIEEVVSSSLKGTIYDIGAEDFEQKSLNDLKSIYNAGHRILHVTNNTTEVYLGINSTGGTFYIPSNCSIENLLDNPDFTKPINQRKATSIIGGVYGLDRWEGTSSTTNVAITSAYLQFAVPSSSSYNLIWQKFKLGTFAGKTLTLAACDADGKWYVGTAVFPESGNAQTVLSASNGLHLSFDARYGYDGIRIGVSYTATSPIRIAKVMMIEGSYTAKMLPPFVTPNFEEELEKCQYFFIPPSDDSGWGVMQVTQSGYLMMLIASKAMRVKPSIVAGESNLSFYIDSRWVDVDTTLGNINMSGNNIFLSGRTTTWPATSNLSNNDVVLAKNLPGLSADY